MLGEVEKLVAERGFGFIAAQDGLKYFLHASQLVPGTAWEGIEVGQLVEFDALPTHKGLRAVDITVVSRVNDGRGASE